jgi:hypothetical protein
LRKADISDCINPPFQFHADKRSEWKQNNTQKHSSLFCLACLYSVTTDRKVTGQQKSVNRFDFPTHVHSEVRVQLCSTFNLTTGTCETETHQLSQMRLFYSYIYQISRSLK